MRSWDNAHFSAKPDSLAANPVSHTKQIIPPPWKSSVFTKVQ